VANFHKNRLEVARELLRKDGFIAITIDHNELFYIGVIADQIFGKENRVGLVTIVHKPEGRQHSKFFSPSNEFMLVYALDKNVAEFNNVVLSEEKWQNFPKKMKKDALSGKILFEVMFLNKINRKDFIQFMLAPISKNLAWIRLIII